MTPYDRGSLRYPPNSRYHGVPILSVRLGDGREVRCLARRFIPDPASLLVSRQHEVTDIDRLDTIAATYLGDSELGWRIADANRAMRPAELIETPGRRLRITLPEGLPGGSYV